ncbi:MAG: DUF1573 domain-containing protein [Planctomycetota bacterium]|jgi:hypothetical protein
MKGARWVLVFVVICSVLLFQAGCQQETAVTEAPELRAPEVEAEPQIDKIGPRLKFEKTVHDFGEIGPGTRKSCEFKFTNTGDELLKIKKISRTCGCTPYTLVKKEYAPGESGKVKVGYVAARKRGPVKRYLTVNVNDTKTPRVRLTVKAKIVPKVDYKPQKLSLSLKPEDVNCPKITLSSLDGQPFSIIQFRSTGDIITADFDKSLKAKKFTLEPSIDYVKLQKNLKGRININLTHPECRTVTIAFEALPRFTVKPASIVVFNAEPLKPVKKQVWILNNYDEDFEIESASSQKGLVKVLSREKVGRRYNFQLEITPPTAKGKRVFNDIFFMQIEGGERLKANCNGFFKAKPKRASSG